MDRQVRPGAREPFALNGGIRRLAAAADAEIPGRLAVGGEKPAVAALNVAAEILLRRVAALPLVQPLRCHKRLCLAADGENGGQIALLGAAAVDLRRHGARMALGVDLVEQRLVLVGLRYELFKKLRALVHGALEHFLPPPAGDLTVCAAAQNRRHLAPLPHVRAGVLRIFQQPVPVALAGEALLVRKHAGDKTAHGVGHRHGGDLAAGQDKVAEGDFLVHALFDEALVYALVVAAYEHQMVVVRGKAARACLVERLALRGHIDDAAALYPCPGAHVVEARLERLRHHNAAPAAAVGVVVHLLLFVFGIVADLDGVNVQNTLFLGAAENADFERRLHRVGEERQNVDAHGVTSLRSDERG